MVTACKCLASLFALHFPETMPVKPVYIFVYFLVFRRKDFLERFYLYTCTSSIWKVSNIHPYNLYTVNTEKRSCRRKHKDMRFLGVPHFIAYIDAMTS